ncbi:Hypothetical protein FKW44_000643 [Caligus rogercresseyi]|uniref:Uncharacterized protein n=1 Tax=Caligus rogercresseyi TaxID=217165 RepID=A0A7T8KHM1_CALRO|nr:Hypothetical protein FKW44_000643 [Caligus rogercresseyi]
MVTISSLLSIRPKELSLRMQTHQGLFFPVRSFSIKDYLLKHGGGKNGELGGGGG